jgi:hypothetical protein
MQRLMDRDFLTALVLLVIGAVFYTRSGTDTKDWGFPLLATYVVLAIGVAFLVRVVLAAAMKRAPDVVDGFRENRVVVVDLLVFCAIVLVYTIVLKGLGFWLSSFLMLTASSYYLTTERTRRNVVLAVVVPVAVCIIAYVIFLQVFYVPLPEAGWFID